jgi:WD40 repeat protein
MAAAFDAWDTRYTDEVRAVLSRHLPAPGQVDRRGFEWYLLDRVAWQPKSIVLSGHSGAVNEIAAFPDGRRLASVGFDGTLRIWDLETSASKSILLSHEELHSVAVSPDARYVAAGSKTVYLCDLKRGSTSRELLHRKDNVESLAFSPDGQRLAAGVRYDELCLLSLDGNVIESVPCASRVESLEFMPELKLLLVPNRRADEQHNRHAIAQLWRDDLSAIDREFDTHDARRRSEITIAKSSPDGKFIAGGGHYQAMVRVFDAITGDPVSESRTSRDRLTSLAYSPDGGEIAAGYQNGIIECFRVKPRDDGRPVVAERPRVFDAHSGPVTSLCYLDHTALASSGKDGVIKIWTMTGVKKRSFSFDDSTLIDIAVSSNGTHIACAYRNELVVATTAGDVLTHRRLKGGLRAVAWSPDGNRVAVCSDQLQVPIFDRQGNKLLDIHHPGSADRVAFSGDGRLVAVIGQTYFQLCDASSGTRLHGLDVPAEEGGVAVTFSNDSRSFAWSNRVGEVFIYDCEAVRSLATVKCDSGANTLMFSADDSLLATGHEDGVIRLWNSSTSQLKSELVGHARDVRKLAFAPNSDTLLSSSSDGTVRLWSTEHSRSVGVFHRTFDGTAPPVVDANCRVSVSADGRQLAIGFNNLNGRPKVLLWDIDYPQVNLNR